MSRLRRANIFLVIDYVERQEAMARYPANAKTPADLHNYFLHNNGSN